MYVLVCFSDAFLGCQGIHVSRFLSYAARLYTSLARKYTCFELCVLSCITKQKLALQEDLSGMLMVKVHKSWQHLNQIKLDLILLS